MVFLFEYICDANHHWYHISKEDIERPGDNICTCGLNAIASGKYVFVNPIEIRIIPAGQIREGEDASEMYGKNHCYIKIVDMETNEEFVINRPVLWPNVKELLSSFFYVPFDKACKSLDRILK